MWRLNTICLLAELGCQAHLAETDPPMAHMVSGNTIPASFCDLSESLQTFTAQNVGVTLQLHSLAQRSSYIFTCDISRGTKQRKSDNHAVREGRLWIPRRVKEAAYRFWRPQM